MVLGDITTEITTIEDNARNNGDYTKLEIRGICSRIRHTVNSGKKLTETKLSRDDFQTIYNCLYDIDEELSEQLDYLEYCWLELEESTNAEIQIINAEIKNTTEKIIKRIYALFIHKS